LRLEILMFKPSVLKPWAPKSIVEFGIWLGQGGLSVNWENSPSEHCGCSISLRIYRETNAFEKPLD